ncbi:MAG: 5-formyltetrahydrofolate cyclo-ligase [Kiritimatiellae bacterium]|nr:5-formyltetrahydrofolate cyclo-ligase [Kiritimatiellia bacterium]
MSKKTTDEKKEIMRRDMRHRRKETDPSWILKASERIQHAIMERDEFTKAQSVGCYFALPYEVQTRLIVKTCWDQGKRVCVPAFNETQNRYELAWLSSLQETKSRRSNIREPLVINRAGFIDTDLIMVPALAYDPQGGRLGHGGGHYDHLLGAWSGIKVGVCFHFQIFEQVPMDTHDIPVDIVITEQKAYTKNGFINF